MAKATLSKRQSEALRRAVDKGGYVGAYDPMLRIGRGSNIGLTLRALEKRGFLAEDRQYPSNYRITDAGRKALESAGG